MDCELISRRPFFKILPVFFLVGGAAVFFNLLDAGLYLDRFVDWVEGLGWQGVLFFAFLHIVAPLFFFPMVLLAFIAGVLFGFWPGYALVMFAAPVSAVLGFLIGRHLVRDWVVKKTRHNPRYRALDEALGEGGWKIVALSRFSPVIPFSGLNYFLGATRIPLKDYFVSTGIAMIPGGALYVYLGTAAGNIAAALRGKRDLSAGEWGLYVLGILATLFLIGYVTHLTRQAIQRGLKRNT